MPSFGSSGFGSGPLGLPPLGLQPAKNFSKIHAFAKFDYLQSEESENNIVKNQNASIEYQNETSDDALAAFGDKRRTRVRGHPGSCYTCGKMGHMANNCPDKNRCYECGESGHFLRECPKISQAQPRSGAPFGTAPQSATNAVLCPFCGGPHYAERCAKLARAMRVINVMRSQNNASQLRSLKPTAPNAAVNEPSANARYQPQSQQRTTPPAPRYNLFSTAPYYVLNF